MSSITYKDGVAIGGLIVYVPLHLTAIYLSVRLGFRPNSGWIFLILFTLARILGFAFQLATINDRTNISLIQGYAILLNIGLSPLLLATMGLFTRVVANINRNRDTTIHPMVLMIIRLIVITALVLGIVGGTKSFNDTTGTYTPQAESKAGVALFIFAYLVILFWILSTFRFVSYASPVEKRLLYCVALSLPFLFVRLLYSILSVLTDLSSFNFLSGSETVLLIMELIMELVVVLIYEGVGLTLEKASLETRGEKGFPGHVGRDVELASAGEVSGGMGHTKGFVAGESRKIHKQTRVV